MLHLNGQQRPASVLLMKTIFLTGATGYIGGTILHELTTNHENEYEVTALVRSLYSAEKVKAAGAKKVVLGDYGRTELLEAVGRRDYYDVSDLFVTANRKDMGVLLC